METTKHVFIGVDPAFRKNGFGMAILDEHKELKFTTFKEFVNFIAWVQNECPKNAIAAIENSYLQNKTFDMRGTLHEVAKKSRNVGLNQAASQIAYELLCDHCLKVYNISPKEKGKKWGKIHAKTIIKQSGYDYDGGMLTQDHMDALKILEMGKTKHKLKI